MFKVNLKEFGGVKVYFRHVRPEDEYLLSPSPAGTTCIVETDDEEKERISTASAVLYYKDRFEKEKGRKYSLTKALDRLRLDRAERTKVWAAYFARKEQK